MDFMRILAVFAALSSFVIIALSFRVKKIKKDKIEELKLQKEIMELEIKKQEDKIKLLEEENKKLDRVINDDSHRIS